MIHKKRFLALFLCVALMITGLTGCGDKKEEEKEITATEESKKEMDEDAKEALSSLLENVKEKEKREEMTGAEDAEAEKGKEDVVTAKGEEEIDSLLESYYETVLLEEEGYMELPCGFEVGITERHYETYTVGEAFFREEGILYHSIWDFDKDDQDEMLVLLLDDDEDYDRSKIYARMYEYIGGEVKETAELESFFGWMEYDISQSTEIFLRETKDWFYLAEEAKGYSGIYADGAAYSIRVAHYDGTDFVVDLAKQMSGSDFSETEDEVADTARLLRNVTFDHTADNLTYEYEFDKEDDLLSVFYMEGEVSGSLDTYYQTFRITDVPPYIIRLFAQGE